MSSAVVESGYHLDGVVALGSELSWNNRGYDVVRTNIDWGALRHCRRPGIALRISTIKDLKDRSHLETTVASELHKLISDAKTEQVTLGELQVDFDCAQKDLLEYSKWIAALRKLVAPFKVVVTTLPAWLDSPAFPQLISNCDGFVLQVHSVPVHGPGNWRICDPALARKWVSRAAAYRKPFAVALPTYRAVAGYSNEGKLLGVAMDSVQGRWPPDTKLREITANPDDLADLVHEWQTRRPKELREILWYRLPVETDLRNWRFATLTAVADGRRPRRHLDIVSEGSNPVDIAIRNNGEADEELQFKLTVNSDEGPVAADALSGYSVELRGSESVFATLPNEKLRLRPGEKRSVGWLRFPGSVNLRFTLMRD